MVHSDYGTAELVPLSGETDRWGLYDPKAKDWVIMSGKENKLIEEGMISVGRVASQ